MDAAKSTILRGWLEEPVSGAAILTIRNPPCIRYSHGREPEHVPESTYFYVVTTVAYPEDIAQQIKDTRWSSLDDAICNAKSWGYDVTSIGKDGRGEPRVGLIHTKTQRELDRLTAEYEAKWANAKPCYVRYGKLPEGGRSRNHGDGELESGVSVYRGERLPNGEARPLPSTNAELCGWLTVRSRQLYIVTGTEIGVGSDGEPVLANCRIWRKAK